MSIFLNGLTKFTWILNPNSDSSFEFKGLNQIYSTTKFEQNPEEFKSKPEQRRFSGGAHHRSGQIAPNLDGSSRAWFLSCTGMPRVLEAWRRSLLTMRSDKGSSHQRREDITCVIRDGRWRSGWWWWNLGKTTAQPRQLAMRKESPNGGANRQLAGDEGVAVAHLNIRKKSAERGKLWPGTPFIGEGERGGVRGPTRRWRSANSLPVRRGYDARWLPYPRSLTGGPRSGFET
jgi:hypothetical protein